MKRFKVETSTLNKKFSITTEENSSRAVVVAQHKNPIVTLTYKNGRKHETQEISLVSIIDVKGWKATGNKLTSEKVVNVELIPPTEEELKEVDIELSNKLKGYTAGDVIDLSINKDDGSSQTSMF